MFTWGYSEMGQTWEKKLNRNDCLLWLYDRTGVKHYGIILALFGEEIFPNENPPLPIHRLHVEEDGEDVILSSIEDDDTFDKVEEYFNDLFFNEVDYDA